MDGEHGDGDGGGVFVDGGGGVVFIGCGCNKFSI
jgi:hypothetical protein